MIKFRDYLSAYYGQKEITILEAEWLWYYLFKRGDFDQSTLSEFEREDKLIIVPYQKLSEYEENIIKIQLENITRDGRRNDIELYFLLKCNFDNHYVNIKLTTITNNYNRLISKLSVLDSRSFIIFNSLLDDELQTSVSIQLPHYTMYNGMELLELREESLIWVYDDSESFLVSIKKILINLISDDK